MRWLWVPVLGLAFLVLAGCAGSPDVADMVARSSPDPGAALNGQISLEPVTVAFQPEAASIRANITNEDFEAALRQSLELAGLLASGPAMYELTAVPRAFNQQFEFDLTAVVDVDYRLVDITTGLEIYDETISTTGEATLAETLSGLERLLRGTERAMQENFAELIRQLRAIEI